MVIENKNDQSKKIQVKLKQPKKEQVKKDVCANKTIKNIKPSEQTIHMNNSIYDLKLFPHHMNHNFKTNFKVLLQEDGSRYLSGN